MARKRLTPARPAAEAAPETKAFGLARTFTRERPPIARVAGESAAEAALAEVAGELDAARAEGRLVRALPLEAIEADHLVRDRLPADDAELAALKASIAARGQQTPIEVVEAGGGRFGLISGWRRLTAFRALHAETGEDRFARIHALVRRRETAAEAYQAMIDENEIRVGLSYWERARIAARAAGQGVFASPQEAIRSLFPEASRAKRSKIGSFLALYGALDGALAFPTAIPERLGLALARRIEAPDAAEGLRARLAEAAPASAEAEQAVLAAAVRGETAGAEPRPGRAKAGAPARRSGGVELTRTGTRRIVLSGEGVDDTFAADLAAWLAARG